MRRSISFSSRMDKAASPDTRWPSSSAIVAVFRSTSASSSTTSTRLLSPTVTSEIGVGTSGERCPDAKGNQSSAVVPLPFSLDKIREPPDCCRAHAPWTGQGRSLSRPLWW